MKQKFNKRVLVQSKVVANILSTYRVSNGQGLDWYIRANDFCIELANRYDVEVVKVCGVLASLSPLKLWEENKRITELYLKSGKVSHTNLFKNKCDAIMECDGDIDTMLEILNGNKISAFFMNVYRPYGANYVTIDRHAVSIALGKVVTGDLLKMTAKQYEFFAEAYIKASKRVGILPCQLQAVTWVAWRGDKNEVEDEVPF